MGEGCIDGNVIFLDNKSFGDGGGAIDVELGSTLVMKGRVLFINNSGPRYGGGIEAWYPRRIDFQGDDIKFIGNTARYGGAVWVANSSVITVSGKLEFHNNHAKQGGAFLAQYVGLLNVSGHLKFTGNIAGQKLGSGGAMLLTHIPMFAVTGAISFYNNSAYYGGALTTLKVTMVFNGSVSFLKNSAVSFGGAFYAMRSVMRLREQLMFESNSAKIGGALYLTQGSVCYLESSVQVVFDKNRALEHGGGVFIDLSGYIVGCVRSLEEYSDRTQLTLRPFCSFQYSDLNYTHLEFFNNTAKLGGSAIYGGALDLCINTAVSVFKKFQTFGGYGPYVDFDSITRIEEAYNTTDPIASDPNRVCTCSKHKKCTELEMSRKVYPGQTIKLPVLAAGQRNGVVPAVIQTTLNISTARLGPLQNTQNSTTFCSNLTYTVFSSESVALTLEVAGTCSAIGQNLTVNLEVLDCPAGFDLSDEMKTCICQWRLRKYTTVCNISDQTIHRGDKHFWVGYDNSSNESGLILHPYCPFDYCTTAPVNFTVNDTDKQCNYNRTGILCGQCKPGFSLVLGASVCRDDCSNAYLSLVIVFIAAGLALVVLLFTLRLTVATGTINGLIFYANIVHANNVLFFTTGQRNVLTVFIALINLDLGIETCFYKELDSYTKTWLQFVFPFYIWTLCIVIILLSRRLPPVNKFLGNNPVAVLATLFLLSYTKILRTITPALSFTRMEYPQNQSRIVWLYDANVPINKWLPLAVFSVVIFFLLLPYTLFLFANQWLFAWADWRLLSWMTSPRV